MRALPFLLLLAACSPPDLLASAVTGKSCSVVNLDNGSAYCQPLDPPVRPMPLCTRNIGQVADCWADIDALPQGAQLVGDTPPPTELQRQQMRQGWLARKMGF